MIGIQIVLDELKKSYEEVYEVAKSLGISFKQAEFIEDGYVMLMSKEDANTLKEYFKNTFPVLDREYLTNLLDDEEPMKCFTIEHGVTICTLTTKSGYVVTGSSAPLNMADYSQELGDKYAADEAFNKLAELEAYHLKAKKFEA